MSSAAGVMRRAAMSLFTGGQRLASNKTKPTGTSCGILSKRYHPALSSGTMSRGILGPNRNFRKF